MVIGYRIGGIRGARQGYHGGGYTFLGEQNSMFSECKCL